MTSAEAATLKPGDRVRMTQAMRDSYFLRPRVTTGVYLRHHPKHAGQIYIRRDTPAGATDFWPCAGWEREP